MIPNTPHSDDRSRGQLILLTGVLLAFMLVALAGSLTLIFGTNHLAEESATPGSGNIHEVQRLTHQEIGALIVNTNDQEHPDYGGSPVVAFREEYRDQSLLLSEKLLQKSGAFVTYGRADVKNATMVRQLEERKLTSSSGDADWKIMQTSTPRRFIIQVEKEDLPEPNGQNGATLNAKTSQVRVVGDGGDVWEIYFYRYNGDIVVSTHAGNVELVYRENVSSARINVIAGSVNGRHVFDFAEGLQKPYVIGFQNGDIMKAQYTVTTNKEHPDTSLRSYNLNESSDGPGPYTVDGIYSATMPVTYTSPTKTFSTTMTVRPCSESWNNCLLGRTTNFTDDSVAAEPLVTRFKVTDQSGLIDGVQAEVDFTVDDNDQNLKTVRVELYDKDAGAVEDSETWTVANGTDTFKKDNVVLNNTLDEGNTYAVRLNATDHKGNSVNVSEVFHG